MKKPAVYPNEAFVSQVICDYLKANLDTYAHTQDADFVGNKEGIDWTIECKGKNPESERADFLELIGQIVFRMTDENGRYVIAIPDDPKLRDQAAKVPTHVRKALALGCLTVSSTGEVKMLW